MGDENPIRTLGDYSKPSYKGYRNTIKLPVGQHWKERACVYFKFPLAIKLAIGLNIFQQDPSPHGRILLPDSLLNSFHRKDLQNSATDYPDVSTYSHENSIRSMDSFKGTYYRNSPHHASIFGCSKLNFLMTCPIRVTRRTSTQSVGGKLRDLNAEESWALLEDLALYDNESWNDPMDFAKMVKAIAFPQDVPSTFDRCLIKLENQVQHLMEAHLTLTQPTQVNKITISCKICSGPHDT
ncbi:hypothetical protein Tco_0385939 [Tanacetum coccineum]